MTDKEQSQNETKNFLDTPAFIVFAVSGLGYLCLKEAYLKVATDKQPEEINEQLTVEGKQIMNGASKYAPIPRKICKKILFGMD